MHRNNKDFNSLPSLEVVYFRERFHPIIALEKYNFWRWQVDGNERLPFSYIATYTAAVNLVICYRWKMTRTPSEAADRATENNNRAMRARTPTLFPIKHFDDDDNPPRSGARQRRRHADRWGGASVLIIFARSRGWKRQFELSIMSGVIKSNLVWRGEGWGKLGGNWNREKLFSYLELYRFYVTKRERIINLRFLTSDFKKRSKRD